MKHRIIFALLGISLFTNIFLMNDKLNRVVDHEIEYVVMPEMNDTLSEWEIFTMALMKVESEYDSTAVSSAGAKGLFQITPIYVKEVNRIHNTEYTFEQVTDFNKAYEIFDLMQQAHNPDYNIKKALILHNGDHDWYHKRVYNEMKRIKNYESLRNRLKNI